MRKRWLLAVALLAMLGLAWPDGGRTLAQAPGSEFDRTRLAGSRPAPAAGKRLSGGRTGGPLARQGGVVSVLIELNDAPSIEVYAAQQRGSLAHAVTSSRRQLERIQQAQQRIIGRLLELDATVLYRTQRVLNGIAVRVPAHQIAHIESLPGVKTVHRLMSHHRSNASSVPLIGAPEMWSAAGSGFTGRGIRIGVLDSGIDYLHADFGGPATAAAYRANDTTRDEADDGFPSAKVAGGYDFVGDAYDADAPDERGLPRPDPDPMDCIGFGPEAAEGHGTHVAGTAAGFGVTADGQTYKGPYGSDTPWNSLRIAPGVAPHAQLYALRIFGCQGTTNMVEAAIEWAVDPNGDGDFADHLDVINLSLGSSFGGEEDPAAYASENAALAGVLVVAAAGEGGSAFYEADSPGIANRVISVAVSGDSAEVFDALRVDAPAGIAGLYLSSHASDYDWRNKPAASGRLAYPASQPSGCQRFDDANRALLKDRIALLDLEEDPDACGSRVRVLNAHSAGARGVVFAYHHPRLDIGIFGSSLIPATLTTQTTGRLLKQHLDEGVEVTISGALLGSQTVRDPSQIDVLAPFSPRGGRRGNTAIKPDVAAPGETIYSAGALTGIHGASISGTSMATAHVAGALALLRQMHADWSVEQIKALLMNTANHDLRAEGDNLNLVHGPARAGAGRIDLAQAAATPVVAYNADEAGLVSLSFGAPIVTGTTVIDKQIRVVNTGNQEASYDLQYRPITDVPGAQISFPDGASLTVPAHGSARTRVRLALDAKAMRHSRDRTIRLDPERPSHWLSEESGYLRLIPSGATGARCTITDQVCPTLRLPVYAAPRPASEMHASGKLAFRDGNEAPITLAGRGISTGPNYPRDIISLVTALELQISDPNEQPPRDDDPPFPHRNDDIADVRYVGVSSDIRAAGSLAESELFFGIAVYAPWSTPNEVEFDIYIDTDRDGKPDFVLRNGNYGEATGDQATDELVTILQNLHTGDEVVGGYVNGVAADRIDTAPFNSTVMVLPVRASDLGLTTTASKFTYSVVTYNRDADGIIDTTDLVSYDAARPGLDFSGGLAAVTTYADLPGEQIPVIADPQAFRAADSRGVLLLHHHNLPEVAAETVEVTFEAESETHRVYLPLITN